VHTWFLNDALEFPYEVLGAYEQLLVSERRDRMQAERDMVQLLRQLRAGGRQLGKQVSSCSIGS
jgi:hypothetical protein